jgi:hypothetical protein
VHELSVRVPAYSIIDTLPQLAVLLTPAALGTVINPENHQRVLIVDFARSEQRAFMSHTGKSDQKVDRLSNSRADASRGFWISLSDVVSDRCEVPERPQRVPQLHSPNFFQVSAI